MLYAVGGKQRAGKTYFVVTVMGDYMIYSKRPLLSNLPLRPQFFCMKRARNKIALANEYMSRISMFVGCYSDIEHDDKLITKDIQFEQGLEEMKEKDPKFLQSISSELLETMRSKCLNVPAIRYLHSHSPKYCNEFSENLIRYTDVRRFWSPDIKKPNSVVFLDEAYEAFSCMYYRENDSMGVRDELMCYIRQHGHTKDDLYIISHNVNDLDVFIRRGISYYYEIRNSKYTNMFEAKWMRGFKYPFQFFIVNGYELGESEPSDSWNLMPDSSIFKCYDSFNVSMKLSVAEAEKDQHSTDTRIDHLANFRNWFKQGQKWIYLLIFICVCYWVLNRSLFPSPKKQEAKNVQEKKETVQDIAGDKADAKKGIQPEPKDKISMVSVSSSCIRYSDGVVIKKGDEYQGAKIVKITKNCVDLVYAGKPFKCDPLGLRR